MKKDAKFYWKLFGATFTLSAFTFGGGYVSVPLMRQKFVEKYHWIEEEEIMDLTAIAQSAPGPIAVNASILIGYRLAGVFGALLIRQPKNAKDWQNILTALATQKLVEGGPVTGFSAGRVTFTCDKAVSWTLDGEFGGERTVTAIENLPRAFVLACGA